MYSSNDIPSMEVGKIRSPLCVVQGKGREGKESVGVGVGVALVAR